jgi:hypothetical protein
VIGVVGLSDGCREAKVRIVVELSDGFGEAK